MGAKIHDLPTAQTASGADMAAVWSASSGGDAKVPLSKLPISAATQQALDDIRRDVFGGGYFRAITLLEDDEKAEVYDPAGTGGRDLATKIQNELDARYLLTGNEQTGAGGHGVWCDLDVGTWTFSTLQLRPGMTVCGLGDRFEIRIKQPNSANAHLIDILGRGQNQDVTGRRTAVKLYNLDLNANGNYPDASNAYDCIHLRVDPDNEGDDDSANRTGLIAMEVQCGGASGWGIYNLKRGKLWLERVQCAGNGLHPNLPNNKVGGLFSQGPDCSFRKVYCGNNGGPQFHIKSSATADVSEIELGVSRQPDLYPSFYSENNTDLTFGGGGNCTGWILIEGEEEDNTANEYDTECRINLYDFVITLKDKSFKKEDGTFFTMPGAIQLKNIRGVHMSNVRVKPATDDDITAHHYTHRPTYLVYIQGSRTRATWRGPLPPLDDWNWPAGTPEVYAGTPTNTYDSITNKPNQLLISTSDPTDTTHSWKYDWISFFANGGIRGKTDATAVQAGGVGEFVKSEQTTPQGLTSTTILNLAHVDLTAGNWEIRGVIVYTGVGATVTSSEACINPNNATIDTTAPDKYSGNGRSLVTVTGPVATERIGPFELKTNASVTRHLNCRATFSAGTVSVIGGIYARRIS